MRLSRSVSAPARLTPAFTAFAHRVGSADWSYRVSARMVGLRWTHDDHYDTLWERTPRSWSRTEQWDRLQALLRAAPRAGWCPAPRPWWWAPLGLTTPPTAWTTIQTAFRQAVQQTHPDAGGSSAALQTVLTARTAAWAWWQTHISEMR